MPCRGTVAASPDSSARGAVLAAAVELVADQGPASAPIRERARHAAVNHRLVDRRGDSEADLVRWCPGASSAPVRTT